MTAHLKRKPKLTTGPDGRVRLEVKRGHRSVSQRIGAEKKAQRRAAAWARAAKGRADVGRAGTGKRGKATR